MTINCIRQILIKIKPHTKIRANDAKNLLSKALFNGVDKATIDGFSDVVNSMSGKKPFKQNSKDVILSLFEQCAERLEENASAFKSKMTFLKGKIIVHKFIPMMDEKSTMEFSKKYLQRFNG